MNLAKILICCTVVTPCYAQSNRNFPDDAEVQSIVKTCAAGYSTSIQGEVEGALKLWRKQGEIKGNGSISELGGIISELKSDDAKVAVFKIYSECIKTTLPQYMREINKNSSSPKRAGEPHSSGKATSKSASGGRSSSPSDSNAGAHKASNGDNPQPAAATSNTATSQGNCSPSMAGVSIGGSVTLNCH